MQGGDETTLHFRQLYIRAVTTVEALDVHGHLLAFERRRDAAHEDYLVDALELFDRCGVVYRLLDTEVDLQVGVPCLHIVEVHADVVALARLYFQHGMGGHRAPSVHLLLALAVDIHLEVSAALNVKRHLAALLRIERRGVAGREILDFHARRKVVHARCGHGDGLSIILCGDGFALALGVIPELAFESCGLSGTALGEQRVDDLVGGEVTAFEVNQIFVVAAQSVENVDGVCRRTVVVAPHHRRVVGIGSDDGDALMALRVEGQDVAAVLQQHERLSSHVERELGVFLAGNHREGDAAPRHQLLIVHLAKVETALKQTDHMLVNFLLADESSAHGVGQTLVGIVVSALHVGARERGACRGVNGVARHLMA